MLKPAFVTQISNVSSDPPAWLDQKELQQLIKEEFPTFQHIESFRCRSEQNGQRVQIQIKLAGNSARTINYLVKSKDLAKLVTLKFPQDNNFQRELHMYEVVLPALEKLYKDVDKNIAFTPSCYRRVPTARHQLSNCLFLDDLQAKGFRSANQPQGLDQSAMEVSLSKLAAYHAATARYLQLNPAQFNELVPSKEPAQELQELKSWLQRKFHESLRSNDLKHYEDKVKSYQKYIAGYMETPDLKRSFNVILNGACWPNNLLGQFDAFGQLKDVIFHDFAGASYGPAIRDLLQLILTASAAKTEQFDACLRYYTDELTENLKLLKFKGKLPSLTDFQLDVINYGHWAFEIVTEILPIVLADYECDDTDELFKYAKYSAEIRKLLPWLENRGYFEVE
ncbi:uncharacterized protein LOC135435398 [Drosophila montana]|uniref:uncharacterized protein LOC135435398 n=1 Tax=Drosophila montana TaxID=40370 RepID=UPI00313A84F7